MVRDLSEPALAGAQVFQTQKMEALRRLANGVAHDLNNLLVIVNGYAEMLLNKEPARDQLRRDLREILGAGEQAAALTQQLLAFGRRQILRPKTVDLNRMIEDMGGDFDRVGGGRVRISAILCPGPSRVRADPAQLRNAVVSILANRAGAAPAGGRVSVRLDRVRVKSSPCASAAGLTAGDHFRLSIRDTSGGFAPDSPDSAFEPFSETNEHEPGAGLELAAAHGIIGQSGGCVLAGGTGVRGVAFRVFLPALDIPGEKLPHGV